MDDLENTRPGDALRALAQAAGISTEWYDYRGELRQVHERTLCALLRALALPADDGAEIAASRERLARERTKRGALPPLVTATVGQPLSLALGDESAGRAWVVTLEDGSTLNGRCADDGIVTVDPIDRVGYHRLACDDRTVTLAVAPNRCYGVADALDAAGHDGRERPWGLAVQLYSVASADDAGLGHFGALADLAREAAHVGASAIAISPVHAMFTADLNRHSPYGPSSRLLTNVLFVDPSRVLGEAAYREVVDALGLADERARLARAELIDWPATSTLRLSILRALFERVRSARDAASVAAGAALDAYRAAEGETLERHARFEALHAMLSADDPAMLGGWRRWPAQYRDPGSPEVDAFARDHGDEIAFHAFLQWQAASQLDAAQRAAKGAGMSIGIVADLAVGADGDGSQAWSRQADMLIGLSVGAPPDLLNALGQSWGLAAFSPRALVRTGFRAWIDMLRASFAHAGGVRIDHVLGLARLWLVPDGADPVEGAYLTYPFEDMLRLVALESHRHRAIVIGEDLGTIPEGLPERLSAAGLLGIRVLWFERRWQEEGQPFREPSQWSDSAIAVTTTHDLPTIAGWWAGRDIDWRARLSLFGEHSSEDDQRRAREADRSALWSALCDMGCADGPLPSSERPPIAECLRFVGTTRAPLALVPLEDALGAIEQPNLPGTVESHPNWRMRLPLPVDEVLRGHDVRSRLAALAEGRAR